MWYDKATNVLYIGGDFEKAGGVPVYGVAQWKDYQWSSVGNGTGDTNCVFGCGGLRSMTGYDGKLFVGGMHRMMGGVYPSPFFHFWDGLSWATAGTPTGPISVEVANGELFGFGEVYEPNGDTIWKVAHWTGSGWEPFVEPLELPWGGGWFKAIAYYKDRYYLGGNFSSTNGFSELGAWDGQSWSELGAGIFGDSWINRLVVYDDLLWVGGYFEHSAGNADDFLAVWDGDSWMPSFEKVIFTSQVFDLQVIDDVLYIVAPFYMWVDEEQAWRGPFGLSRYDGETFCAFGGVGFENITHIAGGNGKLFVSTPRPVMNGDSLMFCAQWMGGASYDYCLTQTIVSGTKPKSPEASLRVSPNPASDQIEIQAMVLRPGNVKVNLMDAQGRIVRSIPGERLSPGPFHGTMEVSALPSGVYYLVWDAGEAKETRKVVVAR
jgi:hypothetical protein